MLGKNNKKIHISFKKSMRIGSFFVPFKSLLNYFRKIKSSKVKVAFICIFMFAFSIISLSLITHTNIVGVGVNRLLRLLGVYGEVIPSVEIESGGYTLETPGSWHINKSAEWTDTNKAKVTFDVESIVKTDSNKKDVILVIDVSGSMTGGKLERAISDSQELVQYLLEESGNQISIITFSDTSTIVSPFTDDEEVLLEALDGLTAYGETNYKAALLNVLAVMNGYEKVNGKDVVTLFLTDGYPNLEIPNEVMIYALIKQMYPYMTVNGVQYEMGSSIINEIIQISDGQWRADQTDLKDVIFEATVDPDVYEEFVVTDYVDNDYYMISSVNDITVDKGEVSLTDENGVPKIVWDLSDVLASGSEAKMEINLTLKNQFVGADGYYPTNQRESIQYKLPNVSSTTVNSGLTPVLKNLYTVTYDANAPTECTFPNISSETHGVFSTVTIKQEELTCSGWLFKGWEIQDSDNDVKYINSDMFLMPAHDVTIRASWSRQSIVKSMSGTVREKSTLYNVLKAEAESNSGLAAQYTGIHQDSPSGMGDKNIYYYTASNNTNSNTIVNNKSNVKFGDYCWQMIRTTDTGGVKLLYNGLYSETNKCNNSNIEKRYPYVESKSDVDGTVGIVDISGEKTYWADLYYNTETGYFDLINPTSARWSDATASNLIGKYICMQNSNNGCVRAHKIIDYYSNTHAYVAYYDAGGSITVRDTFIELADINYGNSPAYEGYMFNKDPELKTFISKKDNGFAPSDSTMRTTSTYSYFYGDTVVYQDGYYYLQNNNGSTPTQIAWTSDASTNEQLDGKYTCKSTYTNNVTYNNAYFPYGARCSSVYYVLGTYTNVSTESYGMYTQQLSNGSTTGGEKIKLSNKIIDNGDGTYSLDSAGIVEIARKDPRESIDWWRNYSSYKYYFYCSDYKSTTCAKENMRKIYQPYQTYVNYKQALIAIFSNDYAFNDSTGEYELLMDNENNYVALYNTLTSDVDNYRYSCLNMTGKCEKMVYFYYGTSNSDDAYYIELENGMSQLDALDEMLSAENVNKTDSIAKNIVEDWYEKKMLPLTGYLEDTVYCNDRRIQDFGGWSTNNSIIGTDLRFYGMLSTNSYENFLECPIETDRFSVSNSKAHLKYPVGLLTIFEMSYGNFVQNGLDFWSMSPSTFEKNLASWMMCSRNPGKWLSSSVYNQEGLRPVVSVLPETEYISGSGSLSDPYIIPIDYLNLGIRSFEVYQGQTYDLSSFITPTGQNLTWSSRNTNVATVDQNGVVTGVGKGSTIIEVRSANAFTTAVVYVASDTLKYYYNNSSYTFGRNISRNSFESITTVNSNVVPSNAIDSWDVSSRNSGLVMAWYLDQDSDGKYELYIGQNGGVQANENSSYAFYAFEALDSLDLSYFDTSNVTNMSGMFSSTGYSSTVFTLDLGDSFDTSNVTDMSAMFSRTGYRSTAFTLDLGDSFNTSNVTNMSNMFYRTGSSSTAFTLDLGDSSFNTSNVTNMSAMFNETGYSSPVFTLDLGDSFNTSNVTDMSSMFSSTGYSSTVFTLDLGNSFDTSNVTNMSIMFSNIGYSSTVFTLDLGDNFDTSNVTTMSSMFSSTGYSSTVFTLDLGNSFDTSNVTNMFNMFSKTGYSSTVFTLDLGDSFDTSNVTSMSRMFAGTGYSSPVFTLDLGDNFDTSNVTIMSGMFSKTGYSSTVFTLDLGDSFDTSNVTNMFGMFSETGYSSPVFTLDLGDSFDTSNVTDMGSASASSVSTGFSYNGAMFYNIGYSNNNFVLDLGDKFVFTNIPTTGQIFKGWTSTKILYVKSVTEQNWIISYGDDSYLNPLSTSNVLIRS